MFKALKTGIKNSQRLEVLETIRKTVDPVWKMHLLMLSATSFIADLENRFVVLRLNYRCLEAQCIMCCTNGYAWTNARFNLFMNYRPMADPNILHLLQRFLLAMKKTIIILSKSFFSNEAAFHTHRQVNKYNINLGIWTPTCYEWTWMRQPQSECFMWSNAQQGCNKIPLRFPTTSPN